MYTVLQCMTSKRYILSTADDDSFVFVSFNKLILIDLQWCRCNNVGFSSSYLCSLLTVFVIVYELQDTIGDFF